MIEVNGMAKNDDAQYCYGTEPYQRELLKLMKDIHSLCEKNGVRYSLAGGSLLGAIRHNGFIPWDDDLDIMFDRDNYNRFIYLTGTISKDFVLIRDKWVVRVEYKDDRGLIGTWKPSIDLFINDNIPINTAEYTAKVFAIKTLQGMMKNKVDLSDYSPFHKVCLVITHCMGALVPDTLKYSVYQKISQVGNKEEHNYIAAFNDEYHLLEKKYSCTLMDQIEKHIFEDTELFITKEYDNYLSIQYGDYMKLPPEEDRKPLHLKALE